ncbi:MAG: DUF1854 domain-containing protein [Chthonomonadales bacterium]
MPEQYELRILSPRSVQLLRAGGVTRLTLKDDRSYRFVQVYRAFPVSDPNRWIAFLDGANKDIGLIENPAELDEQSQRIIAEEIELRYFVPVVCSVVSVREEFGTVYWHVQTDRGETQVIARNLRDNLLELPGGRVLVTDIHGNRYQFPDMSQLDPASADIIIRNL